jgi:beta-1,2-mannobiose phosphorylase / 1,2-beta-oligomannan phosphorylase
MPNIPQFDRLNNGRPILRRIEEHPWENKVVFNPGSVLVEDRATLERIIRELPFDGTTKQALGKHTALCFLFYRAQGKQTPAYDHRRSALGLAVLTPTLELLARYEKPLILPDQPYEDLGAEDCRVSRVGDKFVMFYTAYNSGKDKNRVRIAVAVSTDLIHWEKRGLLRGRFNEIDNKNAMLFPGRVNGKQLMLHRPMEGENALSIHWAEADDMFGEWKSRGMLMERRPDSRFADTWIGGGAPPLMLPDGRFLVIYHIGNKTEGTGREYDFGIAVADPRTKEFIVRRDEPLLKPSTEAETIGDSDLGVNDVVFVCGAHLYRDDLYIPYAGADSVVLGGRITKAELDSYLAQT